MKNGVPVIVALIIAGVIIAGCTGNQNPPAAPVPTAAAPAPVSSTSQQPVFPLGPEYLHKKFSVTSEKDVYTEQFRVTNDPWGIDFTVIPTNTDPQYTWFEMKVTNMDTGHTETIGYGRTYSLDKHQQFPMYNEGPYKFELRGNRVSADVIIAKRNP
jgi:hypothetical protein